MSCCSIRIVRIAEVIVCALAHEGCRGLLNDRYIYIALGPLQVRGEQHWVQTENSQFRRPKPCSLSNKFTLF